MPDFASLNWLAIGVAAAAGFMLGAIWFSPVMFSKAWMNGHGFKEEELADGFARAMIITAIMSILTAIALAMLVNRVDIYGWMSGMKLGALVGVGVVATSMISDAMFARRSFSLAFIEAGHRVVFVVVITVILAMWR